MDRFDFPPYPNAWIQIGWSHELKRGQVKPVRCLGRELVLFRGESGRACLLNAYCPHLGAHLGVGGKVVGNDIRCPFHGWQFDGSGKCTHIAYAPKIPPNARTEAWEVREANGFIMVWHDAAGRPPSYELPTVPEYGSADWSSPRFHSTKIKTRWRELVENTVDRAHFFELHHYPDLPEMEFRYDGPRFTMTSSVPWTRFGRKLQVQLDIDGYGPGLQITRGVGDMPFIVIAGPMPLDDEHIVHRMTFLVSKKVPLLLREIVVRFVIYAAMREFRRDVPIWENKIALPRPVLAGGDGPIGRFRTWANQFYD